MKKRIAPIDGLRAFAVLGVMYTHTWNFFQNVSLKIGFFDLNRLISLGRNGVDLFFVISGFCMYLMTAPRLNGFIGIEYKNFLTKRWVRIAPAFYFILAIECLLYLLRNNVFPYRDFLKHIFFLHIFGQQTVLAPHYWSLATEWHFYMALPFLFLNKPKKNEIIKRVILLMGLCMFCRFFLFWDNRSDILNQLTIPSEHIWYRFVEFGFGVLAAIFYVDKKILPWIFRGLLGFVIALTIVYMGRLLMLKELLVLLGNYSFIPRAFGETVIAFGFTIMLINIIEFRTIFSKFISLDPFLFLGKISYSMYLWHWLISAYISKWVINYFGISNRTMMLAMVVSLAAVIPVSWASYKIFEEFYFRRISKLRVIPKMQ